MSDVLRGFPTDPAALAALSHREAAGWLLADGWNVCGAGDWATVWRSPDGELAARVSPFEPAYAVFVRLCRALAGNPLLPRIELDAPLEGGGRLTVMEFLVPTDKDRAAEVWRDWDAETEGPIAAVRAEAGRLSAEAAEAVPYWGGLDRNPSNVMATPAGEPRLVDLFYAEGLEIYADLLADPAKVFARFPAGQRRYMAEIGAVVRLSSPEEIEAFRKAACSPSAVDPR
ncbi:hypothetical protein [Glycomyces algeriensis]|uniref:Uncharacterized protein n=1 Tax=Glycomyces algeriensis TaxID=256037 RepID=A0A9W6G9A3_9ACTN|nr:hypothetical protein [Glycomyces algeriensis]MDA1365002.1 hypothetical protein [Glycomyces algeriensis]MDR7349937.1 hypothetical protein [Glycomyces algeriensis]GLI42647.1 hypothetical protein GALLR39Z86_24970 [Glycomyces algeriensis]